MVDIFGLVAVSSTFFVVAASPGPATLAAATVSMSAGRINGLRFGAGLSLGLAFWGLLAATGLGAVLQASSFFLTLLKILGGVYLLWLALSSIRSVRPEFFKGAATKTEENWFYRGLLLNLANPKAVVAWIATLSLGVSHEHGSLQVIVASSICIFLGFLIYASYAFIFSTSRAMQTYTRLRTWIDSVVAGLFVLAGLGLIKSAFHR